jgi:hypothetical protein
MGLKLLGSPSVSVTIRPPTLPGTGLYWSGVIGLMPTSGIAGRATSAAEASCAGCEAGAGSFLLSQARASVAASNRA